ncbi:MAG: Ribonuclease 3 [Firmicutes bacterium]|nr:Ribonuclease 3 [candidate division NPL-UPA2 bacterium]
MSSIRLLAERLGFSPSDERLVKQALTHSSYVNDNPGSLDNERLEFLGDAVLSLLCSSHLYRRFPSLAEGQLSRLRANLVCEAALTAIARLFDLPTIVLLGRSAIGSNGAARPRILAGCAEALLGAAYLVGGLPRAEELFQLFYADMLDNTDDAAAFPDAKSALQEFRPEAVNYTLIGYSGPDHDRTYRVGVSVDGRTMGIGEGRSKKQAEQAAAAEALRNLRA